jgi:hypothetical protein
MIIEYGYSRLSHADLGGSKYKVQLFRKNPKNDAAVGAILLNQKPNTIYPELVSRYSAVLVRVTLLIINQQ